VGAARWDEDGGEGEVRPPAAPADEEVEVASVAADEAAMTKWAMSHGVTSGVRRAGAGDSNFKLLQFFSASLVFVERVCKSICRDTTKLMDLFLL
jgi:hypothetical protein